MFAERIHKAINEHDIDAFAACFAADYESEQPAHPARAFRGAQQARKNWSQIFQQIPDIQADLLRTAHEGDVEWAEWHWHGTRANGSRFDMRGTTLMGTTADHIVWGRLYMEELDTSGEHIEQTVDRLTQSPQ